MSSFGQETQGTAYTTGSSRICLQRRCSHKSFGVPPDRRMKETLLVAVELPKSLYLYFEGDVPLGFLVFV